MKLRIAFILLLPALANGAGTADPVKFSRDVLPILSDNCLSCHGPDESHRKAGLRLDTREGAILPNKEGIAAIAPGKPEASELIKRIVSSDPDEVMPTPKSHKPRLTPEQVGTLRRWIGEGAQWGRHWAFEAPVKAPLPSIQANPVDAFVKARLQKEGLTMSARAERHTLFRRLSFDLRGLPPSRDEFEKFSTSATPENWARLVDSLLASPQFGERMAMWWLDVSRYADTDGFQSDSTRSNWPWRDWVADSFNQNKRFDQFTIEQFAGDLLENATPEQHLATCFHRNHMNNGEGGRDPEESRVDYVIDRVNTMGTAFLGLTLGCTQCHSHKFDPISHADYYSLTAFFNSIDETGAAGSAAKPFLDYRSPYAQTAVAAAQTLLKETKDGEATAKGKAKEPFEQWLHKTSVATPSDFQEWRPLLATALTSTEGTILTQEKDHSVQASGPHPNQDEYRFSTRLNLPRITGLKLEVLPHPSHTKGGLSRGATGEFILSDLKVQVRQDGKAEVRDLKLVSAAADFSADKKANNGYGDVKDTLDDDPRNGWTTKGAPLTETHTAVFKLAEPLVLAPGEELVVELRQRSTLGDANIGRFRLFATDQAGETVSTVKVGAIQVLAQGPFGGTESIPADLRQRLENVFLEDYAPVQRERALVARATDQLAEAKVAAGTLKVAVLGERKEPRDTFVLVRGVWDKHGDKVTQDVPPSIAPWPEGEPRNRLGLARWIVSRQNPLTARAIVNQLWQLVFGEGLVRTPEDFGLQGERPTHPELLDWLAVEFMESGWDVKHVLKLIVTSDTYCQSSSVSAELLARDPQNRLLARAPRFRLPSWMLRDAALTAAGLLNTEFGGPPTRPYQPPGVWEELFMGRFKYEPSLGATQYRRTLYAFWRRAIAPTFLFDNAQRRVCEVRTNRTNTPLQALTLLNDETSRESARVLARQSLESGPETDRRLDWLFRTVLSRPPKTGELAPVKNSLSKASSFYAAHPEEARKLLTCGQSPMPQDDRLAETAAYSVVATLLLNLDETITHE